MVTQIIISLAKTDYSFWDSEVVIHILIKGYAFTYSQVIVALTTAGILGMSLYGNYFLEHEFDPLHFLPKDSYLMRFINTRTR